MLLIHVYVSINARVKFGYRSAFFPLLCSFMETVTCTKRMREPGIVRRVGDLTELSVLGHLLDRQLL